MVILKELSHCSQINLESRGECWDAFPNSEPAGGWKLGVP